MIYVSATLNQMGSSAVKVIKSQYNNYIKDVRGMTIVEVIVVVALIGILSIPLINIMGANNNIIKSNQKLMDANQIVLIAEEYVKKNIRFANQVKIIPIPQNLEGQTADEIAQGMNLAESTINYIYLENGELIHKIYKDNAWESKKIITNDILGKFHIDILFEKQNQEVVRLDITINDEMNQVINQLVYHIGIQNLLKGEVINGVTSNEAIVFARYKS